jgi:hypothetical protein
MRTTLILILIAGLLFFAKSAIAQQNPGQISVSQSGNTVTVTTVVNPFSTSHLTPLAKVRWMYFKSGYGFISGVAGYFPSLNGVLTFQRPAGSQNYVLRVRKETSWQLNSGTKTLWTDWQ